MKKLVLVFTLVLSGYAVGQNKSEDWFNGSIDNLIEIRTNIGGGLFGSHSLNLFREGLIYRVSGVDSLMEYYEIVKCVPFMELNLKTLNKLQNTLLKYDALNFKPKEAQKDYIPFNNSSILITFIDGYGNHNSFLYTYCDERVDEIIRLLNELIPKQDRERFHMRLTKCG